MHVLRARLQSMSSADTMGADARYCRLTSASRCRFSTLVVIDIVRCSARESLKFVKFVVQGYPAPPLFGPQTFEWKDDK